MGKCVWIIDDDRGILDVTQIVLKEAGFEVLPIESEEVLLKHLKQSSPDIILLDVIISGDEGREIAKRLKRHEKTRNTPIIMMSAHMDIEKKAKEAGVQDFIKKPYDIADLEAIVRKYIK